MELTRYVESLRIQLAVAAAAGGEEAEKLAERLTAPLDAAARLVLQEALSDAAEEITRELAPGSAELRLRGRELTFVVTPPPSFEAPQADPLTPIEARDPEVDADSGTSRISFRPPDRLKTHIEEAAERAGLSVNAFLVRTLTAALDPSRQAARKDPYGGDKVGGWFR
ncbi:MAG: hypothetical protein ACR2MY_12770 [Candidatus Dormibacteria bacterium]